jgi:hypothetical protein
MIWAGLPIRDEISLHHRIQIGSAARPHSGGGGEGLFPRGVKLRDEKLITHFQLQPRLIPRYTSTPPCVFTARCLTAYKDNLNYRKTMKRGQLLQNVCFIYQTTHHIPDDINLRTRCHEKLTCHKLKKKTC